MFRPLLILLFTTHTTSALAESFCDSAPDIVSRIACFTLVGTGAVLVTASEISSALLPGTDVKVRLRNGSIQPAKLTRKGLSGRFVNNGNMRRYTFALFALKNRLPLYQCVPNPASQFYPDERAVFALA